MATSFHNKLLKVQSSCLDFADLTPTVVVLINALADATGCPGEFIFPLLTIIASCVGINGTIRINDTWSEPAIMWFIVAANKKTAALRLLKKRLLEIEFDLQQQWRQDTSEEKTKYTPQLCIDHFMAVLKNCTMSCAETMDNFWASLMRCRPSIHSLIYSSTLGQ